MDKSNYSRILPKCVKVYQRRRELAKEIITAEDQSLTRVEKSLRDHFKCSYFKVQCFYTIDDYKKFQDHLKNKHNAPKFYCVYCNIPSSEEENKNYMTSDRLVTHLLETHRHRRYQCNLCLYRAISAEHVNIHQSIIHSDIHKSTIQHKQLNGKSCKILECPPPTRDSVGKPLPIVLQIFHNHKHRRLNNDEKHNKDYQCVYCDFMNQSISKVVEHCVQTHPDYHILYYVPEPLVTSTHSPVRAQQYSEIDLFGGNIDTEVHQDNRVTSTEPIEAVKSWEKNKEICDREVDELGFKKKPRISAVQTSGSAAGLSNKRLKHSFASTSGVRRAGAPYFGLQRLGKSAVGTGPRRLNQLSQSSIRKRPMPKSVRDRPSAKDDAIKKFSNYNAMYASKANQKKPEKSKKKYESDESDEATPSKVPKKATQSSLPPLISPQKKRIEQRMICQKCDGNVREFPESQIRSHIGIYHDSHLKSGNRSPFMCGYCKDFFHAESDSYVKHHQKSGDCPKKPENSDTFVDKMIVTKEEFQRSKQKSYDRSTERSDHRSAQSSNERLNDRSDERSKKLKEKKKRQLNYLSDAEYEEIVSSSPSRSPPLRKKQTSESTEHKSKERVRNKTTKDDTHHKQKAMRRESSSPNGYHSSDDRSSIAETDEEELIDLTQPSTSRKTTTIEKAETDSEEEKSGFVCLFCDQTSAEFREAVDHLETHIPDLDEAMNDCEVTKPVKSWCSTFIKSQMKFFLRESALDEKEYPYKCPICVKIARIKQLRPRSFRTFWAMSSHFWEHSCWTPVKCLKCKSLTEQHSIPNCDHLIAKHLNSKHFEEIIKEENYWIRQLGGNKAKNNFTTEQREALEDKYISTYRYESVDGQIEGILKKIYDERESYLRENAGKAHQKLVILPKLVIERLPPLDFDNYHMINTFFENQNKKRRELKKNTNAKKPLDVFEIGSSSPEDSDDDEKQIVITRNKKRPNLPNLDTDEEEEGFLNNGGNPSSDDEIEVIEEDISLNDSHSEPINDSSEQTIARSPVPSVSGYNNKAKASNESPVVTPSPPNSTPSPIKRYQCALCALKFENKKDVKIHAEEEHKGQPISFRRIEFEENYK